MAVNKKQEAKDNFENRLATVLGNDFVCSQGGKIYVWSKDNAGEKIQLAISLTAPVTPVAATEKPSTGFDWSENPIKEAPEKEKVEITPEETQNIADLLASLGL